MTGKVSAGQPFRFPASMYNKLVDLTSEDVLQSAPPTRSISSGIVVSIKNTTGAARARYDAVRLGAPTFAAAADAKADICFSTGSDPLAQIAILLEPIANNKRGRAMIHGLTWAKVAGDPDHRYGDLDAANYRLEAATSGPVILLGAPSETPGFIPVLLSAGTNANSDFDIRLRVDGDNRVLEKTLNGETWIPILTIYECNV